MKVSELIAELQCMNQNAEVHFAYDYGDHWHTHVAPKVSHVFEGYVRYSDYHDMDRVAYAANEEDLFNSDDLDIREVVIVE